MKENSRFNPPNLLTLFRILTVPVVVLLLYTPEGRDIPFSRSLAAMILFTVSSFTDLFDGYIARRYQMVTSLGKLLDPLADKLLVCAAIVMLIPSGRVPAWMVVIIVGREIGVTALRGVASTEGLVIAASSLGRSRQNAVDSETTVPIMSRDLRAGVTQLVEYQLPKLRVAGSNPVARSMITSPTD